MEKASLMRPSVHFDYWFRSEEIRLFLFFPFLGESCVVDISCLYPP